MTKYIFSELSTAAFRLILGGVLFCIIIFSLFKLSVIYEQWLAQYQNAVIFEAASLAAALVASLATLFFSLGGYRIKSVVKTTEQTLPEPEVNMPVIAAQFALGVFSGFMERDQTSQPKPKQLAH